MALDLSIFRDPSLHESFVQWLIENQWPESSRHFGRLWDYYQNAMLETVSPAQASIEESRRSYVQAQEIGLPARITGRVYASGDGAAFGQDVADIQRKEVVIENDIAWRINAMVDFLFGQEFQIVSKAADADRRRDIESILKAVFDANGGAVFFQDMAVLGSVYGFVDCIVRAAPELSEHLSQDTSFLTSPIPSSNTSFDFVLRAAAKIALELIEAPRALPILDDHDYKTIRTYVQHFYQLKNEVANDGGFLTKLLNGKSSSRQRKTVSVTEILGPDAWQRYEEDVLIEEGFNPLGRVPVVHIQNMSQPYFYEGLSDVEQLISLQDELNTRLSDRASRITLQSFKMYLAKGIEGVGDKPVSPGRMWCTDNPDATIEEFGGDRDSPSENQHVGEVREAMDKVSGVTPVVAGVLKSKLGNLSSAVALKMTFMGMLSKTYRKQLTYGQGIRQIASLVLEVLDKAGVYPTSPADRQVEIIFPNPLGEAMNSNP
ncbi:MAG: phage portal protein [Phycisphaerae bacterium]|nr:phage portal protein [Phycisphaerae bacterium]